MVARRIRLPAAYECRSCTPGLITETARLVAHGDAWFRPREGGLPPGPRDLVRRVPAAVADLSRELGRGQHPADGPRHGPREPVPVRLDRLRRAVHHHRTAGD